MDNKKKYHGGLSALFVTLFAFLCLDFCVPFSSCYARTTLTDDEANYIYDYIFKQTYDTNTRLNLNDKYSSASKYKDTVYQDGVTGFKNWFNNNNTINIDPNTTFFIFRFYTYLSNNTGAIYVFNCNNSKPNGSNLPFLYILFDNDFSNNKLLQIKGINDNKEIVDLIGAGIDFTYSSNAITYSNYREITSRVNDSNSFAFRWTNQALNWNIENINNGDSILQNIPGIVSFSSTNAIYTNYNGQTYFNTPVTRLLYSPYSPTPVEPDNPDNPTDTGNTGTITNNNGETTGSIDLSGITSGINKIEHKIPSSRRY